MANGEVRQAEGDEAPTVEAVGYWEPWPFRLVLAHVAFFSLFLAAAVYRTVADDHAARVSLGFLAPLVDWIVARGAALRADDIPLTAILPAALALSALYLVLRFVPWFRRGPRLLASGRIGPILAGEVVVLELLTLVTIVFRLYALNVLPRDNVGEMVFSVICTSDVHSMLAVNGGAAVGAPWAPLGLLYFLLMGVAWRLFGSTILAMRLASAINSIVLAQLLYWLMRKLGGPLAAVIAVVFWFVMPVSMVWGRHDMFPFPQAGVFLALLAIATYYAITHYHWLYWLAVALLMGATAHLFGSGLAGFLLPLGVVVWLAIFDRRRLRRCSWKTIFVFIGLGLWAAGPSMAYWLGSGTWMWISPFDPRLASRAFRGAGWTLQALDPLRENVDYVLRRFYVGIPADTHQTPIAIFGIPSLYVPPLVSIFLTVGLVWMFFNPRTVATPILLAFAAAGLMPGITSYANAHRETAFFPAVAAIAALPPALGLRRMQWLLGRLGTLLKVLLPAVVLSAMILRVGAIYFSQPMGEPPTKVATETIRQFYEPGTLLVLSLPYALSIDVTYMLFDDSLKGDRAYEVTQDKDWPAVVKDPQPSFDYLFYRHTALKHEIDELRQRHWKHVVYVLHNATNPAPKLAALRARYPNAKVVVIKPESWRPLDTLIFVIVDL